MSFKGEDTTTVDFITKTKVFLRDKTILPCPWACSGGAQSLLEFQTVIPYMHVTSENSSSKVQHVDCVNTASEHKFLP